MPPNIMVLNIMPTDTKPSDIIPSHFAAQHHAHRYCIVVRRQISYERQRQWHVLGIFEWQIFEFADGKSYQSQNIGGKVKQLSRLVLRFILGRYWHCIDNHVRLIVSINTVNLSILKLHAKKQTCFGFVYKVRPVSSTKTGVFYQHFWELFVKNIQSIIRYRSYSQKTQEHSQRLGLCSWWVFDAFTLPCFLVWSLTSA